MSNGNEKLINPVLFSEWADMNGITDKKLANLLGMTEINILYNFKQLESPKAFNNLLNLALDAIDNEIEPVVFNKVSRADLLSAKLEDLKKKYGDRYSAESLFYNNVFEYKAWKDENKNGTVATYIKTQENNLVVDPKDIVKYRKSFGMRQSDFANLLDYSLVSVNMWENLSSLTYSGSTAKRLSLAIAAYKDGKRGLFEEHEKISYKDFIVLYKNFQKIEAPTIQQKTQEFCERMIATSRFGKTIRLQNEVVPKHVRNMNRWHLVLDNNSINSGNLYKVSNDGEKYLVCNFKVRKDGFISYTKAISLDDVSLFKKDLSNWAKNETNLNSTNMILDFINKSKNVEVEEKTLKI